MTRETFAPATERYEVQDADGRDVGAAVFDQPVSRVENRMQAARPVGSAVESGRTNAPRTSSVPCQGCGLRFVPTSPRQRSCRPSCVVSRRRSRWLR